MLREQLSAILELHKQWLSDSTTGKRANLRDADFCDADLRTADLTSAYLTGANFDGATLAGANLSYANLVGARLTKVSLAAANLTRAILTYANLSDADLINANLQHTQLQNANFTRARLWNAKLTNAILPHFQLCPQTGDFHAWKNVYGHVILELLIQGGRTSSLVSRKCRTSKVTVLRAFDKEGTELHDGCWASCAAPKDCTPIIYELNKEFIVNDYDPDIRVDCTRGIHFFITREEAVEFGKDFD